mmetsp:Transcript_24179/g.80362  ORF Transcript_24179/g.80362 Transcript_24179/m.80362 type:complete len:227 (+) Transcript_24179:880-1560(+)
MKPASTATTRSEAKAVIWRGVDCELAQVPWPSWPMFPWPHEYTSPSDVTASESETPAATERMRTLASPGRGVGTWIEFAGSSSSASSPWPRRPGVGLPSTSHSVPHDSSVPSGDMNSECDIPAAIVRRPSCARRRSSESSTWTRRWHESSPSGSFLGSACPFSPARSRSASSSSGCSHCAVQARAPKSRGSHCLRICATTSPGESERSAAAAARDAARVMRRGRGC